MLWKPKNLVSSLLTLGPGHAQNFLGATWVPWLLSHTPERRRRAVALRLLSLSPHYFRAGAHWPSGERLEHEADRNERSRRQIVHDVLRRYLKPDDVVLDYGCGAGFMAQAVSLHVRKVVACDISQGALACACVLNSAPNVTYVNMSDPAWTHEWQGRIDLAYSFAVAQHLTDSVLAGALRIICALLRPGGLVLVHVVINASEWRTESDWINDSSLQGRLRLKYALHCFSRSPLQVLGLMRNAGFLEPELIPLAELTTVDDDIRKQHLVISRCVDND